jgi:hypothetical protein
MSAYVDFGRHGSERRDTGLNIQRRLSSEMCIPIDEEDGWRLWFWFPGRSMSATAHWWVHEAGTRLIGEWVAPSDDYGRRLHEQRMQHPMLPCVFADGDWNTSMVLQHHFRASPIPKFAIGKAEASECGRVKIGEDMHGEAIWHRLDAAELCFKWLISQLVAELNKPDEYLVRLLRVFNTAQQLGWAASWLNVYLPFLATRPRPGGSVGNSIP